jgi:two-component system CheB/CheR fusion protein
MGIKRIKEKGGAAFVQNPREAEYDEMPRNSIATDLIDDVLNVAEIPAKIIAYKKSLGTIEIAAEPEARPEDQQQALREVFAQLRHRTGHDFSNYKRPTLLRRIERRINLRNLPNLPAYAAFIREHPEEAQGLLKDLLISVTNFFRDAKAFASVEHEVRKESGRAAPGVGRRVRDGRRSLLAGDALRRTLAWRSGRAEDPDFCHGH